MKYRNYLTLAGVLATALTLSACATSANDSPAPETASSSDAATAYNDADVMFAQGMAPHHQGAIDMAQVVLDKQGIDPRVTDLAQRIEAAQGPEIDQLNAWLAAWGTDDMSGMPGMDHGSSDGSMPGMSDEDMSALQSAEGADASRLFLQQMIVHHQSAIDMAQTELTDGMNPDAQKMAQDIVDAQQAEITEMQGILATL